MIIQKQVIEKSGIPLFKKLLHVATVSQKLTANNVANVSTPGYQSQSIDFKKEMQKALHKERVPLSVTNPGHIPSTKKPAEVEIYTDESESNASGVNNVDIDKEMGSLAENQILFTFGAKMAMQKFTALKNVIRGRS
ncbi:MAG: flagellar basal body rod protein FlgB [candidate division Zixibacteria bacterium]|jgi:flagellar basal-body rod protein FlgB|nr:flagellar basal body rod protein FlgB [candidate division Zixibacteria bacterium]